MVRKPYLIPLLVVISSLSFAQSDDYQLVNSTYDTKVKSIYDVYSKALGKSLRIYNGPEYVTEDFNISGHPFFESKTYRVGSVMYEGQFYDSIEMTYDIYRDELIIVHYDQNENFSLIKLLNEKVGGFSLSDNDFILIVQDTSTINHPPTGYYEVLYDGNLKVFAKRIKKTRPSSDELYRYEFQRNDIIYLLKDNTFHSIRSKASFRRFLEDEKKSVKEYVSNNVIRSLDLENYMVLVSQYYDRVKEESSQ